MSNEETSKEPRQYVPTVVIPTPGRVVWFYPARDDRDVDYTGTPEAAIVAYVWGDRLVNLMVIDADGMPTSRICVPFLQEGDAVQGNSHACWMPYQINQARKARREEDDKTAAVEVVAEDFLDPVAQDPCVKENGTIYKWTEKEIDVARVAKDHPILMNRIESLEQIANKDKAAKVLELFHEIKNAREMVEKAKNTKCTCPSFVLQYENALKQLIDRL